MRLSAFQVLSCLGLLLLALGAQARSQGDAVDLRDVQALTFRRGMMTKGRRAAPVPQLSCTQGDACARAHKVDVVQCRNVGDDDLGEVQWACEADVESSLRLGKINVNCEGYSSSRDRLKLRGSCGLEFGLHFSEHAKQDAYYYRHGRDSSSREFSYPDSSSSSGDWMSSLFMFGLIGLAVVVCMREQQQRNPGSQGTRPPPYNPSSGAPPPYQGGYNQGPVPSQPPQNQGNGFWSGAALGGILGSLFGGRGGGWGNNFGYGGYQGGWGNGFGFGRRQGFGGYRSPFNEYRTGYSSGSRSSYSSGFSGGSQSTGTSTRRSTGYGGTSTR